MRRRIVRIQGKPYLPLDNAVLELLGIVDDAEVEVSTDGLRLLIAPVHIAKPADHVDAAELPQTTVEVLRELRDAFVMKPKHFQALHHLTHASVPTHLKYCEDGKQRFNSANNVAVARRLIECRRLLRAGASWESAINAALALYPLEKP
jgi:hypothetical protein